ncbi:RING finger protein 112-like [Gastrophryne carolinensis]
MEARRGADRPGNSHQQQQPPPGPRHDPPRKRAKRRPRRERAPPEQPIRNDATPQPEDSVAFQSLMEDITCSICLDDLRDPVSITCGHTFCTSCITTHWTAPSSEGYLCPECRTQCSPYQLAPDYRLSNLITKIQRGVQEQSASQSALRVSPGVPLQLVWTDGEGRLRLDSSVVSECFASEQLSRFPVYLLCVIGEKRRGKSFLMNYIMRALESQEKGEPCSLGAEEEPLQGFEWRSGIDSTTKGVWIWSRPFILGNKDNQVLVYLLDTEGSLDIEGDRESCIKLSALSMLLSSHLIFNVASCLKETELDYLEMYLHMGEEFTFQNLQYLDILVRDWHDSGNCGTDAARFYINREIEKLQKRSSYPKVLWGLKSSYTRCFLLPHPGKGITGESQGRLQDMDEDFQESLRAYISDVVRGVWHRVKTDHRGQMPSCVHLPSMLQEIVKVLEQRTYGFSTPMEMFYAVKNQKSLESIKREMVDFLSIQPSHLLPSTMRTLLADKQKELSAKFSDLLLGPNSANRAQLLQELEEDLKGEAEKFCSGYATRFTCNAIGLGVTAGIGLCGVMGAAAARGTVVMATQPAVVEKVISPEVAAGTVTLLKNGLSALVGRFFRGGL